VYSGHTHPGTVARVIQRYMSCKHNSFTGDIISSSTFPRFFRYCYVSCCNILNPNSRNREVYFELVLYAWTFSWKWSKSKKLFKSKYPLITKYISHKHNGVGAPKLLKCWWKSIYLTNKTNKTFFLHIFFYFFILAHPGAHTPPLPPLATSLLIGEEGGRHTRANICGRGVRGGCAPSEGEFCAFLIWNGTILGVSGATIPW